MLLPPVTKRPTNSQDARNRSYQCCSKEGRWSWEVHTATFNGGRRSLPLIWSELWNEWRIDPSTSMQKRDHDGRRGTGDIRRGTLRRHISVLSYHQSQSSNAFSNEFRIQIAHMETSSLPASGSNRLEQTSRQSGCTLLATFRRFASTSPTPRKTFNLFRHGQRRCLRLHQLFYQRRGKK